MPVRTEFPLQPACTGKACTCTHCAGKGGQGWRAMAVNWNGLGCARTTACRQVALRNRSQGLFRLPSWEGLLLRRQSHRDPQIPPWHAISELSRFNWLGGFSLPIHRFRGAVPQRKMQNLEVIPRRLRVGAHGQRQTPRPSLRCRKGGNLGSSPDLTQIHSREMIGASE